MGIQLLRSRGFHFFCVHSFRKKTKFKSQQCQDLCVQVNTGTCLERKPSAMIATIRSRSLVVLGIPTTLTLEPSFGPASGKPEEEELLLSRGTKTPERELPTHLWWQDTRLQCWTLSFRH